MSIVSYTRIDRKPQRQPSLKAGRRMHNARHLAGATTACTLHHPVTREQEPEPRRRVGLRPFASLQGAVPKWGSAALAPTQRAYPAIDRWQ